ncbi:hypothetical protein [Methylorubrum populi]|uniref:Uncharacterized protein n=1 Tax=Methylorubrum populi TaxID=223967 RepID=A0A833N030_9HYPH|nr:hypothetical protein [Methylorubrum populi]KAB7786006.1 hypothetical protein F8B43_1407 [Methylorubrum populi]
MLRVVIAPYIAGIFTVLFLLTGAFAKSEQSTAPFSVIGVIRYGSNDSAIGKLTFLSKGQNAEKIFALCKMGDLCEVSGDARGEEIVKVTKASRVKYFDRPKDAIEWVYSHFKEDSGSFWLEDYDLGALFTPRMTDLMVKSRRAAEVMETESVGAGPWTLAQDWIIRGVKVEADDRGPGKSLGMVTFRNFAEEDPKPRTITFDMVQTDGGWRIEDMQFPPEKTARFGTTTRLSEMLKIEIAEGEKEKREKVAKAAASGSLCNFGEGEIFTCSANGKQYSICTSSQIHDLPHKWIEYRAGTPIKRELVHRSTKVGSAGGFYGAYELFPKGEVSYVRFSRDGYDYTAFSDENSRPQTSGVIVKKEGRRIARIKCSGGKNDAMPRNAVKVPSNMILAVPFDADQFD